MSTPRASVVLTRDADAAAPFLRAIGEGIAIPVTAIEAIPEGEALLGEELREEVRADAIVVASRNAAAALVRAAGPKRIVEPVYAVGEATAAVLRGGGVEARVRGGGDGASLARAIVAELRSHARVLLPCALERREEPIAILRDAGLRVEEVHVYRTVPRALAADERARLDAAAVLVVFAPSQVDALAAIGALAPPALVAIGGTTAAALHARHLVARVASAPTPEAVAAAVRAVYPAAS